MTPNFPRIMKRIQSCEWIEQREKYKETSIVEKIKKIYIEKEEEYNQLQEERLEKVKEFIKKMDSN